MVSKDMGCWCRAIIRSTSLPVRLIFPALNVLRMMERRVENGVDTPNLSKGEAFSVLLILVLC